MNDPTSRHRFVKHNCPFECHQLLAVLSKVGKLQHNGILGHFRVGMHTKGFSPLGDLDYIEEIWTSDNVTL